MPTFTPQLGSHPQLGSQPQFGSHPPDWQPQLGSQPQLGWQPSWQPQLGARLTPQLAATGALQPQPGSADHGIAQPLLPQESMQQPVPKNMSTGTSNAESVIV